MTIGPTAPSVPKLESGSLIAYRFVFPRLVLGYFILKECRIVLRLRHISIGAIVLIF